MDGKPCFNEFNVFIFTDLPPLSEEKSPEEEIQEPKTAEDPLTDKDAVETTENSAALAQDSESDSKPVESEPQSVEPEAKSVDSIPTDPEISSSECSKETPSLVEKPVEENQGEEAPKPDSEDKPETEEVSKPQEEESVPEARTDGIEEPEEAREKNLPDCEDSSSSAAEFAKFQTTEEEKTDAADPSGESEATKKTETTFEKNVLVVEPENTEFVQISQEDKHDESQIENQSIDNAEDPFGGDNLDTDNLEEGDNLAEEIPDFQKLGDQADNLQDVVKAKDNFQPEKSDDDKTEKLPEPTEDPKEAEKEIASETAEKEKPSETESPKGDDKEEKISAKDGIPEEVTPEVLPGQDDELCIIPDSPKVILPGETVQKGSCKEVLEEIGEEIAETVAQEEAMEVDKVAVPVGEEEPKEKETVKEAEAKEKTPKKKSEEAKTPSDDVISIDDESKSAEIEEIVTKEKCKECGEERSCKIKVKVGSDCFNVCSKECKNTFKAANNKATDIPSDGVNSKREKRCAGCLLIVEASDERNLSWETMEFCNEECLGKFQTKYGSYCRNCNGSVQAVSLGKYCVRFGYDVRQFCCSTCLEEFKKGLKVCSYCQKDISSGMEGFLAPVGDKGQFKDFCTQDCMEKYSRMSSTEPPNSEKKACSVCQEVRISDEENF